MKKKGSKNEDFDVGVMAGTIELDEIFDVIADAIQDGLRRINENPTRNGVEGKDDGK